MISKKFMLSWERNKNGGYFSPFIIFILRHLYW